jgi:hypothetical protein
VKLVLYKDRIGNEQIEPPATDLASFFRLQLAIRKAIPKPLLKVRLVPEIARNLIAYRPFSR